MPQAQAQRLQTAADIILAQLGGRRFIVTTGAKNLAGDNSMLSMKLPATMTKGRASHCRITLEPTDTYKVETLRIRRGADFESSVVVVDSADMVFADQLQAVFTRLTGLDTHL